MLQKIIGFIAVGGWGSKRWGGGKYNAKSVAWWVGGWVGGSISQERVGGWGKYEAKRVGWFSSLQN